MEERLATWFALFIFFGIPSGFILGIAFGDKENRLQLLKFIIKLLRKS